MKRFLSGLSAIFVVSAVFAWLAPRAFVWGYDGRANLLGFAITVVLVPVAAAWLVTEIYHAARPRRIFNGHRRGSLFVVGYGAAAGIAALAMGGVAIAYLDTRLGDAPLMGASTALAAACAVALLGRRRRGRCVYCGYDLRAVSVASGGGGVLQRAASVAGSGASVRVRAAPVGS